QGYVMASNDGSDDPGKEDTVLILRDPLTGKKLQCKEEVEEWRELHEDVAVDRIHDHRAGIAAGVISAVIVSPVAAAEPLGALAALGGISTANSLFEIMRTESPAKLLATAIVLYDRKRYPQASLMLEHALAKGGYMGTHSKALYYLGLSYNEEG